MPRGVSEALPAESAVMTVNELAQYFRISRVSAYKLFNTGALTPIKIGGRTMVRRADADAFLAGCPRRVPMAAA
ncbi:DNA binding domain-containing protein, excisionase family [Methylorubrum salsuginis]|uniref:DNA binding domain-containing protein, excisionase family n=2 Tax=Methylorubrum salsuginis TaxID=414703 RepID=A0A1I4D1I2_9HYPH|nr:DNA binding domain-containing protein, excisionase family [Methylorubrum salsuginis]